MFNKFNERDFYTLQKYFKDSLTSITFNFLRLFEESDSFKFYYENDEQKINLVEISEMLKAEVLNEDGWIERFSKELNKEE